jgi:NAD(P)-dependent dehydrogenase (short-subunit alcohol dehydrogenase family)
VAQGTKQPDIVVIIGASGRVGRATAQAFARRGAHIGLLARGQVGLESAKRDVERLAIILQGDTADPLTMEQAAGLGGLAAVGTSLVASRCG